MAEPAALPAFMAQALERARAGDAADPLAHFRDRFHHPNMVGDTRHDEVIYLCGNSLGLQPKAAREALETELEDWARYGVEGHLHARHPWFYYHHEVEGLLAELVGARTEEVVAMNALTVNLNLMLVSFYRPTAKRYKILLEAKAFPSDQYTAEMQARFHAKAQGFDPEKAVVEIPLRDGEHHHRPEDVLAAIAEHGEELALVMIGGVNYYSGQFFDLKAITEAGHAVGAQVGFDLAHAVGNVPLELHDQGPDFAVWCSYKYLNSGPGGVSGAFVHERHANSPELPRFAGWWGNAEKTRFQMQPGFHPQSGAAGWQMSNAPVLNIAVHRAALELFREAGFARLREKSLALSGLLRECLEAIPNGGFELITPREDAQRGCQLSILTDHRGKAVFEALTAEGIIADWREPNVIRLAPVPLYNRYEDVVRFAAVMAQVLSR